MAGPRSINWHPRETCVKGPHAFAIDGMNNIIKKATNVIILFSLCYLLLKYP